VNISVLALDGLEPRDLLAIRSRMTHADSEWQAEATAVLHGEASNITPVALCHIDAGLVGWACSHIWREMQTLEQWVDDRHRRHGIATALSAALMAHGSIDRADPLAVFSESTEAIAKRLGCKDVRRYWHDGTEWVPA
jgi:GNAT superfamily N-acetyltransferase